MPTTIWVIVWASGLHSGGYSERRYLDHTLNFIERTGFYKDNIQSIFKITFK